MMNAVYALGAYEELQYIRDVAEKIDNLEGLKILILNEYDLVRENLHKSIMEGL